MAELLACGTCGDPRPRTNLILVEGAAPICPECRAKHDYHAATHQVAAPAPVNAAPPRDLYVVDVPRSTKLPRSSAAGRRRRSA